MSTKTPDKQPTITQEYLDSLRTPRGGFTRETVEYLGLKWPPKRGWPKRLIGQPLPTTPTPRQLTLPGL